MVLGTLRVDNDEGSDASPELPGPSGTYPYTLPVGSPPPASRTPTLDMGPYATVTPALSLYLMASASSFCGHLGLTLTSVVGAPPWPLAVDGTAHAKRIGGWSLELDTLPLADTLYPTGEMMFYIGNYCYFDLSMRTVQEMRACLDVSIVPDMAIPLGVWFAAMWGMRYLEHLDVSPAVMLHRRLVCHLNLAIRGYRVRRRAGREFGMSPWLAARREAQRRRYRRDRVVRLERRARVLVDEFHEALGFALDEFLTPEDRLCYQQVHDGMAEQ